MIRIGTPPPLQGSEAGVQSTPNRDAAPERVCTWKDGQAFSMPCVFSLPLASVLAFCFLYSFRSLKPTFIQFFSFHYFCSGLPLLSFFAFHSFFPSLMSSSLSSVALHLQFRCPAFDSSWFLSLRQNYHVMDNAKDKPCGGTHSNSWSPQDVSIGWWPISMKHKVSPWPFPSPSSEFQTNLTSTILISSNKGLSYSWCWRILDLTDVFFRFSRKFQVANLLLKKTTFPTSPLWKYMESKDLYLSWSWKTFSVGGIIFWGFSHRAKKVGKA